MPPKPTDALSPFEKLKTFLTQTMRMSHIYQPVIIKRLLEGTGSESVQTLAEECLAHDAAQIEYYISIVKRYPKQTLLKHEIISAEDPNHFTLEGYASLSQSQREVLIGICEAKTQEYIDGVGGLIGGHRYNPDQAEGSLRYQVLKNARGKCVLCGVHASDSPIDVDHIVPKSLGGSNDLSNLQALCFRCNRGKGNSDQTDFRG